VLSEGFGGSRQGRGSPCACRIPRARSYLDFHQKLLGGRGPADKARAMAAAKDAGLDTAKIEKDLASPEVKATIEKTSSSPRRWA